MSWQIRHQGSPQARAGLSLAQIVEGLRDGLWEPTDEVMGPNESQWVAIENHSELAEIAEDLEPPPTRHPDETHLDMNALIDVCLVLLIFFMLTTSYVMAVQKVVPLPDAAKEKQGIPKVKSDDLSRMVRVKVVADNMGLHTVLVENQTADDVLKSDRKSLDAEKFKQALLPYTRGGQQKTELLLTIGDKNVTWGMQIAIQDAARSAGIRKVHRAVPKGLPQ